MKRILLSHLIILAAVFPLFAEQPPVLDADFAYIGFEGDPEDSDGYVFGMDQAPDGSVYLATKKTLIKLDASGRRLWYRKYGEQLVWAWNGVGVDNEGSAYVAVSDYINSKDLVLKYDGQGNLMKSYEFPYAAYMTGVAFDRQRDRLYALSYDAVTCFDKDLNLIRSQALAGVLPGNIWYEAGLDIDAAGNVYAGGWDYYGGPERYYAALKYAPELLSLVWASTGSAIGEPDRLNDIVAAPDGGACVSGVEYSRDTDDAGIGIRCFSADGQSRWGILIPGGVDLAGLASDRDGSIYIGTALQDYSAAQLAKLDGLTGEKLWTVTEPYGLQFLNTHVDGTNRVYSIGWPMAWGGEEFFISRYLQGPATDAIPPATVADLAVAAVSSDTITLAWTAPGDDLASGTATSYDLRYATAGPVASDADFDNAAQAHGEPAPQLAGSAETFILTGLTPGTTYFFGIKATDDAGNVSGLSNSPGGRTSPAFKYAISRRSVDPQIVNISTWSMPLVSFANIFGTTTPAVDIGINFTISTFPAGAEGFVLSKSSEATNANGFADVLLRLGNIPAEYGVTATCNTCEPSASTATFTCCGKLPSDEFRQGDMRWSTHTLGSYPPANTIGRVGCALTSVANMLNFYNTVSTSIARTSPDLLNTAMIQQNGYNANDDIRWDQVDRFAAGNLIQVDSPDVDQHHSQADIIRLLDADLALGRPVILRGEHPPVGSGRLHFMLAIGKCQDRYIVADPNSPTGIRLYEPNETLLPLRGVRRYEFD